MASNAASQNSKDDDEFRVIVEPDDLPFEEEIIRNQYNVKLWLRYAEHKRLSGSPLESVYAVFERSVRELPGSYKLWYTYLNRRCSDVADLCISDSRVEAANKAFERALVYMNKMPRIWIMYLDFMVGQGLITRSRRLFDRALRALPITQHHRIWPLYLKFVTSYDGISETALRVYRRFIKLSPDSVEEFIDYLRSIEHYDEAACRLVDVINDDKFRSMYGKSKHQLWNELCELIAKYPDKITSLKVEPIIRQGIRRFTNQVGLLWCSLADYYIRAGHFERARDIYEEAMESVLTVRDFSQIFDAYAQFEETIAGEEIDDGDDDEVELRLARLERLMERRPLLLNSVVLRQNPHNVHEWLKRVTLYEGKPLEIVNTYTEAVQTVDPRLSTGKLYTLWVDFAKFYESHDQLEDARLVFERATKLPFPRADDLSMIWAESAEMELRHDNHNAAISLLKRATAVPPPRAGAAKGISYHDESEPVQNRVHRSLKLWSLLADLEECFGDFNSCKTVYDKILDLRIATPQIVINFTVFLEEHNYFEEAFRAYERGISLFKWPIVYDLWLNYLTKFTKRYGGSKLERARDLFEQCIEHCPQESAKPFYLRYAKMEEEFGLARRAMQVYDRATNAVTLNDKMEMFNIYIKRAAELYGLTYTRPIYEKAIEELPDSDSREMCLRFADLERKLGEIDRARAIYTHCSQMCDPRTTEKFWQTWKEFEIKHGNEDTLREMLRIKRSVQALYNTQVDFMAAQMMAQTPGGAEVAAQSAAGNAMAALEEKMRNQQQQQLQAAGTTEATSSIRFVRGGTLIEKQQNGNEDTGENDGNEKILAKNPAEIDINFDDGDDGDDGDTEAQEEETEKSTSQQKHASKKSKDVRGLEKAPVPLEVFGGLVKDPDDEDSNN